MTNQVAEAAQWVNVCAFYTDLDRLFLECLVPLLGSLRDRVQLRFCERHYAGGPHFRIRVLVDFSSKADVERALLSGIQSFVRSWPSETVATYSPRCAAALLEKEGEFFEAEQLHYRVNCVEPRPYERRGERRRLSEDGCSLLEEFLDNAFDLTAYILATRAPKMEMALRLMLVEALFVSGSLPEGVVSFRSHLEGFLSTSKKDAFIERIKSQYREHRNRVIEVISEVSQQWSDQTLCSDRLIDNWLKIMETAKARALCQLAAGRFVTSGFESVADVREAKAWLAERGVTHSKFIDALYVDERFMYLCRVEPAMMWPRVITNLLYSLFALIGITIAQRTALCYYVTNAGEEHCECRLIDILQRNIDRVVARNAYRLG